jgi:hypothetical protein
VLITASLGVPNWPVIYIINTAPPTDKPWFLTKGKLLLCSSYLPLGVPNWSVIYISTLSASSYFLAQLPGTEEE